MRANEFITEDRLDEALPIVPIIVGAGIAVQAYETYQDYEEYRTGKIDKAELYRRGFTDAAIAAIGGIAGKGLQAGWIYSKAGINALRDAHKAKKAAEQAGKVTSARPGGTIRTPKGDFVAGIDGKATTVKANSKAARKARRDIRRQVNKQEREAKASGAGVAGAAATKADDVAKNLAGRNKPRTNKKPDSKKPEKAGAGAAAAAKKPKFPAGKVGAATAAIAGSQLDDKLNLGLDKDKTAADRKTEFDKLKGQVVYTGFEKDPPVKRFDAGGLGTKTPIRGEVRPKTIDSKTMVKKNDSSSTVGSKTPKLPKQNKDPLSQQQGAK